MAVKAEALIVDDRTHEEKRIRLEERRTPELVIAFVGPVGSGVTKSGHIFAEILQSEYNYKSFFYKVSHIIKESGHFVGEDIPDDITGEYRIKKYQNVGNKLR